MFKLVYKTLNFIFTFLVEEGRAHSLALHEKKILIRTLSIGHVKLVDTLELSSSVSIF